MKVTLITGVAGTTGSQILDYLSKSKEVVNGERKIVGIDNFFRGTKENIEKHLNKEYFDFYDSDFRPIERIFYKYGGVFDIDEVYHMAAIVPTKYFYENPDLTYEVNCQGTIDLFNWCKVHGVKRFIVGSSSEIYGHIKDEDLPAKEDTMSHYDAEEVSTRWSYAEGKILTEHYLNHFKDKFERVCHLRFANTYGPRDLDNNHVLPYFVNCVVNNEDIHVNKDYENFYRTFLHNEDSARACVELMKKGRNGVAYNVGSSQEVNISGLLELIIEIGKEYGINYSGNIIKDIDRPGDPRRRVLCTDRLYEDTGFRPEVSLGDGIRTMFDAVLNSEE